MAVNKTMTSQNTLDLVKLHAPVMEGAFMGVIRDQLHISEPLSRPQQLLVYEIHFNMVDFWGGLTTRTCVDHIEVEQAVSVPALLKSRAASAGAQFVQLIMDTGARQFAWDNASRWQRLKWAWRGLIPHPIESCNKKRGQRRFFKRLLKEKVIDV